MNNRTILDHHINMPGTSPTAGLNRLARSALAALALLCLATFTSPHAAAQCGANTVPVPANQWVMLGVPCVPPSAADTIAEFFGPSLNVDGLPDNGYGTASGTWIAYKKGYSAAECPPTAADPDNCYVEMPGNDVVTSGDAVWVYSLRAATLDLGTSASSTAGPSIDFPARLSPGAGISRYSMFANPYDDTVIGPNLSFPYLLFGIFPGVATLQTAIDNDVIRQNAHYWNGNTYFTEDLTTVDATFIPKEAAWLEWGPGPGGFVSNLELRVTEP